MLTAKHSAARFLGLGLFVSAATMASLLYVVPGSALSGVGPDPVDMGMGVSGEAAYVLAEQSNSIRVRTITIPLYFDDANTPRVLTITGLNLCSGARDTAPTRGNNYRDTGDVSGNTGQVSDSLRNSNITVFSVPGTAVIYGRPSTAANCYAQTVTVTVPRASMALDPTTRKYKVTATASMPAGVTNIQNHFRISLNNGIVGYSSDASADNFAIAQDYPQGVYRTYSLPFAPPCTATGNERASIRLYDDDNGTPGVQPTKFFVYVQQIAPNGAVTEIPLNISATQISNASGNRWYVSSGNQQTATITATFLPLHKYRFVLQSVYSVNLLQFQLPYDSINYNITCPKTKASCDTLTVPRLLLVGQSASFQVRMRLSASYGPPMNSDNPRMTASISGPAGVRDFGQNTYSVSGTGASTLLTSSTLTYTPPTHGTYTLTWKLSGDTLEEDVTCTQTIDAGYRPYFSVTGGDILSGGGIRSWNVDSGSYFGAGTSLAAIATGDIQNFVTGFSLSGGAATRSGSALGFANSGASGTRYGGNFALTAFSASVPSDTVAWPSATLNLADPSLQDGKTYVRSAGNLTITGQLPSGKQITVVVTNGSVHIASNITYGAYTRTAEIPRFTLLLQNGSIYVNRTVTEIHGVYSAAGNGANGTFYSCANGMTPIATSAASAYGDCNNRLLVYGAVAARNMTLTRTYGSLVSAPGVSTLPAEEFLYTPELWLAEDTSDGATRPIRYDSYVSLPPVL